jgi:uncharacterized protein DUF6438
MLKKLFSPEVHDICPNCGESCATSAILCPKCGKNLDELFEQLPDLESTQKLHWLANLLGTVNTIRAKYLPLLGLLIFIIFIISIRVHLINFVDTTPAQDVVITVERTMCFGFCPAYRLSIYGNGKAVYEGRYYVRVEGARTTYIPKRKVRELVAEFQRIGFYDFDDQYIIAATDFPSVLVSIDLEGRSKTIDMYGAEAIAPEEIANLIKQIEEAVNVARWVGKPW